MKFYKNELSCQTFTNELSQIFYPETQEGFDRLALEVNARIDSSFTVSLNYLKGIDLVGIAIRYSGEGIVRSYYTCFKNNNMFDNIARIEDIITAFASGIGYDC